MTEITSEASVSDRIEEKMNLCDQDKFDEEPDKSLQDLVDSLNKLNLEFNQIYGFYQQSSNESQKTIDRLTTELEALRNKNSKNSINQNFGNETAEKSVTDTAVQCEVSKLVSLQMKLDLFH
ncbi:hypothetical protein CEXT_525701 [Caerostris extrusa]|uniref:Uncharacterized protein n=1 Tax=Caerostris extrusa TaxID=172846 RepID=A0AAV4MWL6_CAEEX|nr:hypothetical protein CEXT_525701 [Caerostris extrusa]